MTHLDTNMQILKPSRRQVNRGDVFVLCPLDGHYLHGRVISTSARWTLAEGADPAFLIYIYSSRSAAKTLPNLSTLVPDRLLVAPIMTNRTPWTRGYFETLTNVPLASHDVLAQHAFFNSPAGKYYDDNGNELSTPAAPVGDYGLHSFRTIDDEVSRALGIPLAPENP